MQKNILGYAALNVELYNRVVHACDLERDFEQLENGDQTVVGSKGLALSGGQKQRVVSRTDICRRALLIRLGTCSRSLLSTGSRFV